MIKIIQDVIDKMVTHAKRETPDECCGILAGVVPFAGVAGSSCVTEMYEMSNLPSDDPRIADLKIPTDRAVRYMMDPKDQFNVLRNMRKRNLTMLGIYHSHPHSPAFPSITDVRLAFYPDVFYLILSLMETNIDVRAFFIVNQKITEATIERIKNESH
jgi:proteasome lid subunit RPN8/RPN11